MSATTSSSICSPFLAPSGLLPLCSTRKNVATFFNHPRKPGSAFSRGRRTTTTTLVVAMRRSEADQNDQDSSRGGFNGRMVDENMIVLRKRIHEMNMIERNYEPPEEWMDWEKRCYTSYDAMICEAVGLLQMILMNSRPSFALGMMGLVALSVPTSLFVVVSQLIGLLNSGVFAGIRLSWLIQ